ncbi:hypothetical protein IT084_14820 [Desulfallas sp. Bu1-1]|uniref:hypothetical protein n=1 Tax=Desulfallas sp. Bu1-1 TaxID=2787620 RepID=UPI00189FB6EB|nr:hypothetical protein [Desulfallas sp. Bu1-1]MBF7084225.1 hypothetical protein [Desulfallas sp. Bu1-1]
MQRWKSVLISLLVIMLGLSVILNEAGVLTELSKIKVGKLLNPLGFILYAIAVILAWRRYRMEGTSFYKWLAISLTLKAGLLLESIMFRQLQPPMQFIFEQPVVYKLISLANYALQQGGGVLVALLLIYTIGNYGTRVRFYTVFKPCWMAMICLTFIAGLAINIFIFNYSFNRPSFAVAGYLVIDSLLAGIYIYGFVLARQKIRVYGNMLLKWLALFFALDVITWLINIIFTIIFLLLKKTVFSMAQIHLMAVISIALPALLVIALIRDKNKEAIL